MKYNNITVTSWDIYNPDEPDKNIGNTIAIPDNIYYKMINELEDFNPLFVEITKSDEIGYNQSNCRCLIFGNIISIEQDVIVLPYWAMSKFGLEPFVDVNIENVNNLQKIDYIQVRANQSDYVYWSSLKEQLEDNLSKIRAISIGDMINVHGIEFYVCKLKNELDQEILDGSLFNTDVKIDFDIPSDILEEDRLKKIKEEEERIRLDEERIRLDEERIREEEKSKNKLFVGKGYSLSGDNLDLKQRILTREEMAEIVKKRINQNK
jgi:hypothetical protein